MATKTARGTHTGSPDQPEATPTRRIIALTIAGLDPTSGAGLTADLKVFAAHGLYGVAAATALTVQSTAGVRRVEPVNATLLADTLACLAEDLPLDGIKIGMLATAENVDAVADFLRRPDLVASRIPIVLDPVLRSTSGHPLLDPAGTDRLRTRLLPRVTCITPNLNELLLLTGTRPTELTHAAVAEASAHLATQHPHLGIIATGGHLPQPDDYVLAPGSPPIWLSGERVHTRCTHGTGCGYSSALLCGLVNGLSLLDAASAAKHYVTSALRAAIPMGQGGGAMDHLHASHPRSSSSHR
jgi:hydroxymethylpyrimidine/phosphomethylpyrimidine kinase